MLHPVPLHWNLPAFPGTDDRSLRPRAGAAGAPRLRRRLPDRHGLHGRLPARARARGARPGDRLGPAQPMVHRPRGRPRPPAGGHRAPARRPGSSGRGRAVPPTRPGARRHRGRRPAAHLLGTLRRAGVSLHATSARGRGPPVPGRRPPPPDGALRRRLRDDRPRRAAPRTGRGSPPDRDLRREGPRIRAGPSSRSPKPRSKAKPDSPRTGAPRPRSRSGACSPPRPSVGGSRRPKACAAGAAGAATRRATCSPCFPRRPPIRPSRRRALRGGTPTAG